MTEQKEQTLEQELLQAKSQGHESNLLAESRTYKPFHYPWAVEFSRQHENMHWIEDEVDLGEDVVQWKGGIITELEKNHLTHILRLFTQSDVAVGKNYYDLLIPKFRNNEIRNMLGSFAAREAIHQRAYALLNDTLGLPEEEYHAFLRYKEMAEKIDFMITADPSTRKGLALTLVKSVLNEGLSLFASFVMLLNYQRFGKMRGTSKIIAWSLRDEQTHVDGISKLFRVYCSEHPRIVNDDFKKEIFEMTRKVVKLEDRFLDLAYEMGEPEGLSKEEVRQYIRYIADRRLIQLGLKGIFRVKENPLPWLGWIVGDRQEAFFETRVTAYDVNGLHGSWGWDG